MRTTRLKLVTIVAEAVLEQRLIAEVRQSGATGCSVGEVRGEGSRGVRASDFEGKNIRLETVVTADVADRILEGLADRWFQYAVIAWVADVDVVRGDKYV
jgi:hypothetical protein